MQAKKIIGWAAVAFMAYYLLTNPSGAQAVMQTLLGALKVAGTFIATFLNSL